MRTKDLVERLNQIRAQAGPVYTNMYRSVASSPDCDWECEGAEQTVLLFYDEGGARRLQFLTADLGELKSMLLNIRHPVTLDIISRGITTLSDILNQGGFATIARMQRLANRDISSVFSSKSTIKNIYGTINSGGASEDDARQILDIFTRVFDTRISHLPSLDELKENIRQGEVVIHKEAGRIHTILQRTVAPKRFYIHQVYNDGEKAWLHGIMLAEFKRYYAQGGRYVYAWVQDTNIASQKMHAKYGLVPDGLWDIVYTNQP